MAGVVPAGMLVFLMVATLGGDLLQRLPMPACKYMFEAFTNSSKGCAISGSGGVQLMHV